MNGVPALESISPDPPRAVRRAVMLQGWRELTAIHWRYDPEIVQALLPPGFSVDTFDGSAWVGLIPFRMTRIRVPRLPAFGPLSTFPETNVRTYIVDPDGRRAVWFFSLDVNRLLPALVARGTYRLPYCWGRMTIDRSDDVIRYVSDRRWPAPTVSATSRIEVRIGDRIAQGDVSELDHFLSARWALGSTWGRRLMWARVDHEPWPLHRASLVALDESLIAACGLPAPAGEPLVRWSPGVEVRIERPRIVSRQAVS